MESCGLGGAVISVAANGFDSAINEAPCIHAARPALRSAGAVTFPCNAAVGVDGGHVPAVLALQCDEAVADGFRRHLGVGGSR